MSYQSQIQSLLAPVWSRFTGSAVEVTCSTQPGKTCRSLDVARLDSDISVLAPGIIESLGRRTLWNLIPTKLRKAISASKWNYDPRTHLFAMKHVAQTQADKRWKLAVSQLGTEYTPTPVTLNKEALFVPNIGICDLRHKDTTQQLQQLSIDMEEFARKHFYEPTQELISWDRRMSGGPVISGFGTMGAQWYIKAGLTVTSLHDEIGWSSAINYMLPGSDAIALWVGFSLKEMEQYIDTADIADWTEDDDLVGMLNLLLDVQDHAKSVGDKVPSIEYVWQRPGDLVHSPCGSGHAHFVITLGRYAEQLATNTFSSNSGIHECMQFWSSQEPRQYNCGMATSYLLENWEIEIPAEELPSKRVKR